MEVVVVMVKIEPSEPDPLVRHYPYQAIEGLQEQRFRWDAPGPTVDEALAQTFDEYNCRCDGQDPTCHCGKRQYRSLCVGDFIQAAGSWYRVQPVGFQRVSEAEAARQISSPGPWSARVLSWG